MDRLNYDSDRMIRILLLQPLDMKQENMRERNHSNYDLTNQLIIPPLSYFALSRSLSPNLYQLESYFGRNTLSIEFVVLQYI